jgi:hypothetical protein
MGYPDQLLILGVSHLSTSAENISIRVEWLSQSGCPPSQPSETPRWRYTPRPASITRVALHIPLQSPFPLALAVSYFKETLWSWGQQWPYIGMGSSGTCLHRDCNAIGDGAKISPHILSTLRSRIVGRRWADMILHGSEDQPNCIDPRNPGKS